MCLAIPGKILRLTSAEPPVADVDFGGIQKSVSLDFVPAARPGDHVLVHVGVALQVIDQAEAELLRSYLRKIGEDSPDEGETSAPQPHAPAS